MTCILRPMLILHRWLILSCVFFSTLFAQTDGQLAIDITFKSQGHDLKGKFFQSKHSGQATALLLLHGFPGNEQDVLGLGQKLSTLGINILTFNYSGTYQSEGEYSIENTLKDIRAAYDYLHHADVVARFHLDTTKIILGGYSYGGGMALIYAAEHQEITRLISIGGTDHGELLRQYRQNPEFGQKLEEAFDKLKASSGAVHFEGSGFLKTVAAKPDAVDLRLCATRLVSLDILLIGGWDDAQVTIDHHLLPFYRALKTAGASTVTFIAYHTDHSFRNVREQLADQLIRWIRRDTVKNTR